MKNDSQNLNGDKQQGKDIHKLDPLEQEELKSTFLIKLMEYEETNKLTLIHDNTLRMESVAKIVKNLSKEIYMVKAININNGSEIEKRIKSIDFREKALYAVVANSENILKITEMAWERKLLNCTKENSRLWLLVTQNITNKIEKIKVGVNSRIIFAIKETQIKKKTCQNKHGTQHKVDIIYALVHNFYENKTEAKAVGKWRTQISEVEFDNPAHQCCQNIKGASLKIATIQQPPWVFITEDEHGDYKYHGVLIDMFKILAKMLELNYTLSYNKENDFGSVQNSDSSWTGIIGELQKKHLIKTGRGEGSSGCGELLYTKDSNWESGCGIKIWISIPAMYAKNRSVNLIYSTTIIPYFTSLPGHPRVDIGLMLQEMSSDKLDVLDFSPALLYEGPTFLIPKPKRYFNWTGYLLPFEYPVWLILILVFVVIAVCLIISQNCEVEDNDSKFMMVFAVFIQQGVQRPPRNISGRILFISYAFFTLLIIQMYNSTVISYLTVTRNQLPFSDIQGLISSDYRWIVQTGSDMEERMVKKERIEEKKVQVQTAAEGVNLLNKYSKVAYLGLKHEAEYMARNTCNFTFINLFNDKDLSYLRIAYPKHSLYQGPLDTELAKMVEGGIIQKLLKKYTKATKTCETASELTPFTLKQIILPFLILLAGKGMSEKMILGTLMSIGILAGPTWVSLHIKEYRADKE
ncbi:Glutamate receptor 2 [Nymphon striatum]|nr:Glutamate receptor 2 [Nymphon striatum]